ncbi:MAG: NUDIX domain-containing protein [Anaerolineae bacterium]
MTTQQTYNPADYDRPSVTVDVVIFTILDAELKVLLVKRKHWPFEGRWAFPGGFVKMTESLDEAAHRELNEETGLSRQAIYLEQLYTFGTPNRDPRTRVITVAYFALVGADRLEDPRASDDAADVAWFSAYRPPELAFDHNKILDYAITRLRYKLEYSAVGFQLLPQTFTLRELQEAYEIVLGEKLDKGNFRSKLRKSDVVEPTKVYRQTRGRPARLYQFKHNALAEVSARRLFP